ncbi:MAG: adenosylcobinamide-phosphate synthase CbiB [Thermodesulforhabdaceae bacterium]
MSFSDFSLWHLITAYVLDLIIGDPYWMPHPVRWIGSLISYLEKVLYPKKNSNTDSLIASWNLALRGGMLVTLTITIVVGTCWVAIKMLPRPLLDIFFVWLTYTLLATRSLHIETKRVIQAVETGDIEKARKKLAWLVSRDTENLDEKGVLRGTLETLSENISDGVLAPLFCIGIGGPIMGLLYKTINTLDSMIGYKNERYLYFGKIAARLDDVFNYIPARLTGVFIVSSSWIIQHLSELILKSRSVLDWKRGWQIMKRDGKALASPNSGIPQAAMAGALGIQLGGPSSYFGKIVNKPTMGDPIYPISIESYKLGVVILYLTSAIGFAISIILKLISFNL